MYCHFQEHTWKYKISCMAALSGTPSGHMGRTTYTANGWPSLILDAIFSASSIGISWLAPIHKITK